MFENREKHRQNSHLINHCPTSEGMSEVSKGVSKVSERANKWAQQRAQAKRVGWSKQTSERCEWTSERKSEWSSTPICILGYSGPQCVGPSDQGMTRKYVTCILIRNSKREQVFWRGERFAKLSTNSSKSSFSANFLMMWHGGILFLSSQVIYFYSSIDDT